MTMKKILTIFFICILAASIICAVSATGKVTDLKDASGLKVTDDGKLIDKYDNNKEIGNVTPIKDVDEGEKIVYGYDPNLIEDYLSTDPLVKEYNVEDKTDSSHSGIYFMFGHNGDIFLGFVKTENMGHGMLKRITEFGKYNAIVK